MRVRKKGVEIDGWRREEKNPPFENAGKLISKRSIESSLKMKNHSSCLSIITNDQRHNYPINIIRESEIDTNDR